jgi:hypothetical protein
MTSHTPRKLPPQAPILKGISDDDRFLIPSPASKLPFGCHAERCYLGRSRPIISLSFFETFVLVCIPNNDGLLDSVMYQTEWRPREFVLTRPDNSDFWNTSANNRQLFVVDRMEIYYVEEFHVKGVAQLATNFCPRLQLLQCCVQSDIP